MHTKFEKVPSKDVHFRGNVIVAWTDGQTDGRTDGRTDRQTVQKQYAPDLSIRGHKNISLSQYNYILFDL